MENRAVESDEQLSDSDSGSESTEACGTQSTVTSILLKGRPHPEHVNEVLESLYKSGMTGWGSKHSTNLEMADKSTGLNLSQVTVSVCEYCSMPVLKKRNVWQQHRKNFADTPGEAIR